MSRGNLNSARTPDPPMFGPATPTADAIVPPAHACCTSQRTASFGHCPVLDARPGLRSGPSVRPGDDPETMPQSSAHRARASNDPLANGPSRNTARGRRYKDLVTGYVAILSERVERPDVRARLSAIVSIQLYLEELEIKVSRGEEVDHSQLVQSSHALTKLLDECSIVPPALPVPPRPPDMHRVAELAAEKYRHRFDASALRELDAEFNGNIPDEVVLAVFEDYLGNARLPPQDHKHRHRPRLGHASREARCPRGIHSPNGAGRAY